MRRMLTFALLLCAMLLNAQDAYTDVWNEIDTLIAHGHYAAAYEKSSEQLKKAKRRGNGHDMLKAVYAQRVAAAAYQEGHVEASIEAYEHIMPHLKGADKSMAHLLLAALDGDKRAHYEAALAESTALKAMPTAEYDLLIEGDTMGLRLRPTLYDVVVHAITDDMYLGGARERGPLSEGRERLFGTAEEFASLALPADTASYALWQLGQLQALTRHHLHTEDAAVRAHVDVKRMQRVRALATVAAWDEEYMSGGERMAESYHDSPTEQAMLLYQLAEYCAPQIETYTDSSRVAHELAKAYAMEGYIQRIALIAPHSEWNTMAQTLYRSVTHTYLALQGHTTLLAGQEQSIALTVRNMGHIACRVVPRHAGEHSENFVYSDVMARGSVGRPVYISQELPNAYVYKTISVALPPLEAGDYFVIATNDGQASDTKRVSITAISVTNLKMSMMPHEAEAEYIGMVLDATTGKAVTDCEVVLMESSGKHTRLIERYYPDEKGYLNIPLPSGRYRNLYLRASDGLSHTTYQFKYADFLEHSYWAGSEPDASTLFTFLPDRYTYEPGDTVRFAIMAYSHDEEGSSVKNHRPIGLTLVDARRKEIGTLQGITDEWGSYSGWFALPHGVTPGRFRLQVTDSLSKHTMYHTINVEAFKAPTFTAELERPVAMLRWGDSLTLQGTATTYTGLPVIGAKVRYEATVNDMGLFGYHPMDDASEHILSDTTYTDEEGHFRVSFMMAPETIPHENATWNYIINATVTDISGETQCVHTSFIVGQRTKHAQLYVGGSALIRGDSIGYSLLTLNGQRLAEPVTLRLSKLEVPQHTGIRASQEYDAQQWSEEAVIIERSELTSAERVNYITMTDDMPCGTYRLTVTYIDGGKVYSEVCHFDLWGEGKRTVSSYALYTTAKIRDRLSAGDTAVVYVGTRHSHVYTHYYVKVEGRVVSKGTLCLTDEAVALRIPIEEKWRNSLVVCLASVKDNVKRLGREVFLIEDKANQLDMHLSTLRDSLEPGDREQCTVTVSDYRGKPVQAALTLSVYDAALDIYGSNEWDIALAPQRLMRVIEMSDNSQAAWGNHTYVRVPRATQPRYYALPVNLMGEQVFYSLAAPATVRGLAKNSAGFDMAVVESLDVDEDATTMRLRGVSAETPAKNIPYMRQHLSHTALFIPMLHTDAQGRASFTLTAPDLLSRWHVKGMAHTKDMKYGRINVDFITRKMLMVQPSVPRFLYEGDICDFTAKVTSSSGKPAEVVVRVEVEASGSSIIAQSQTITMEEMVEGVSFPFTVPTGVSSLTYRITAQSGTHSDGEQGTIIILPRRTLVTETMALYVNGKEKREFVFEALKSNHSETLEHHRLSLDMVSTPIWYAIEALPPLCEDANPTNEQLFHRYYATLLAQNLMKRYPEISASDAFYHADSLAIAKDKWQGELVAAQQTDGGWAWMDGFSSDRYTTLLIIKGIGELEAMGCMAVAQDEALYTMVKQGVAYLDRIYLDHYEQLAHKPRSLDSYALYYLYARSMFPELPFGIIPATAYEHYRELLLKDKATQGTLMHKALKMLTLIRMGEYDKASKLAKVVSQSSLSTDEMGIYWRDNRYGYGWDNNPVATQALLIEAFVRLGQPISTIGRMQQWLLKQKQTTHWESSIATAQAVHALVVASPKGILNSNVEVKVDGKNLLLSNSQQPIHNSQLLPSGKQWMPEEIRPALAKVSLQQHAETPSWGSMTWQYYEEADKVKASGAGLSLKCTYYKVETQNGKEVLTALPMNALASGECRKGDRIRVRMQFTADRAMDYVELRMQRPATLEPMSTRSGYTYDRGLAYYRSVENARTTYYLYRIDKGSYTIEFDSWASLSGDFASGLSTIQCVYAPVFMATAESVLLKVE